MRERKQERERFPVMMPGSLSFSHTHFLSLSRFQLLASNVGRHEKAEEQRKREVKIFKCIDAGGGRECRNEQEIITIIRYHGSYNGTKVSR